jgi:hypothetical protein
VQCARATVGVRDVTMEDGLPMVNANNESSLSLTHPGMVSLHTVALPNALWLKIRRAW